VRIVYPLIETNVNISGELDMLSNSIEITKVNFDETVKEIEVYSYLEF